MTNAAIGTTSRSLAGKVAIVTGGARGIGRAVVESFSSRGAHVVVNASGVGADGENPDPHLVRHLVSSIIDSGGSAVANHDDVADTHVGERLVEQAIESFGRLDIVVNAAGILRDRMVFNMTDDEWDEVVRVHLRGHFSTIRPAARYWRSRRNPDGHYRIINVTSDSGLQGSPGQPNYAAAKMGIVGLTYSTAQALARFGVTANAIAPGALTRMIATIPDAKQLSGIESSFTPENVAEVIAYVAGEQTDWLTGRVVGVSGLDVRLFSNPEVVASLVRSPSWSDDELDEHFRRSIRPLADGLPPSSFASQLET